MEGDAVVHIRIQIVRLIVADDHIAGLAQRRKNRVGKAAVEIAGESDFPRPGLARQRWRHGMNRNRDGWHAPGLAFQQDRFDRVVIRPEPAMDASSSSGLAEMQVAWDHRPIARFGNQIRSIQMAVAVDDQA